MRLTVRRAAVAAGMVGLAASAFALGWWDDGDIGRRAKKAAPASADWAVPEPRLSDLSGDAKILAAKQPFGAAGERGTPGTGGAIGPGANAPPPIPWRIGGIVTTENSRYLVVLLRPPGQNAERTELRQVGEDLPDGSVVRSVDPSSVTIDREGTLATIRMFIKN